MLFVKLQMLTKKKQKASLCIKKSTDTTKMKLIFIHVLTYLFQCDILSKVGVKFNIICLNFHIWKKDVNIFTQK
ncbi:hypothetical protein BN3661_00130 [Eubacteriaceae bacterium CHKCI005]|uniref:Uncharacterized protein n=1 Tax=Solibaculum mannosilyticum TaxID=2780922 RepID=A0A7I8D446_9FIRM|nr:hypothetical protein C12CBH8_09180 [Solibaculum mannosilyticum]CZT55059.1 hypothetical protein BN3661_00130 [Eubacteriaceae bacterium CHKCI005]